MDLTAPTTSMFHIPSNRGVLPQEHRIDLNTAMSGSAGPMAPSQSLEDNGDYVERDRRHTGVAGVARDILGTLGDFLLTRMHMPAMYGPAQEHRREAAATEGFDTDPLSAIRRLESINPEAGRDLRNQYIDNQRLQAQQESTAEARDARIGLAQQAVDQRTRGYAASMVGSMVDWDEEKRQQNWPQVRAQALLAARKQKTDLSSELPETYDPIAIQAFMDANVPLSMQRTQRLAGDRISTTARGQDLSAKSRAASLDESRRAHLASEEDRDASRADARERSATAQSNREQSRADRRARSTSSRSAGNSRTPPTPRPTRRPTISGW